MAKKSHIIYTLHFFEFACQKFGLHRYTDKPTKERQVYRFIGLSAQATQTNQ